MSESPMQGSTDSGAGEQGVGERAEHARHYHAQVRDWGGGWMDDGRTFASFREARDKCIAVLASLGYSGCDIRVLRCADARTEVVSGD